MFSNFPIYPVEAKDENNEKKFSFSVWEQKENSKNKRRLNLFIYFLGLFLVVSSPCRLFWRWLQRILCVSLAPHIFFLLYCYDFSLIRFSVLFWNFRRLGGLSRRHGPFEQSLVIVRKR